MRAEEGLRGGCIPCVYGSCELRVVSALTVRHSAACPSSFPFPPVHRKSVEESLAKLGCGHLDLLLVHWPEAWVAGSSMENPQPDNEVREWGWRAGVEEAEGAKGVEAEGAKAEGAEA